MIDATHVIFPHGAGGTNLLFAPPPCKVLEILQEGNIQNHYAILSSHLGHSYSHDVAESAPPDMKIDVDVIAEYVKAWVRD
jgi:capsular polysaccharide biosynthesis protein